MHMTTTDTAMPAQAPAKSELSWPLRLTEAAVGQVKLVLEQQGLSGYFLSIRVVPSGCSGFGYDLNLIKDANSGDVTWEQDGVRIATDALSARYLQGTDVDFVSTLQGQGFKFQNPNAKSSCGCGNSFNT
jgi:iron-sulfur cluster assembly protein